MMVSISSRGVSCSSVAWGTTGREAGNPTEGWQDKRGSPVVSQAIDMAWLPACLSVGWRAAIESFRKNFNDVFGTARIFGCAGCPA